MIISLNKWLEDTGYPKSTFRGWKPKLTHGKHYFIRGRTTSVDPEEMDAWLRMSIGTKRLGDCEQQTRQVTVKARRSTTPILRLA